MSMLLLVSPDLMVQTRVEATLAHAGHRVRSSGRRPDQADVEGVDAILLDLNSPEWEAVAAIAREAGRAVLAFGQHVDEERLRRAREAGCTLVVARSRFFSDMPQLVSALLASQHTSA